MDQRLIDLHVHSTESDGTLTPVEIIEAAKEARLSAVALTDHDTVSGIKKAAKAAKESGVELISGIELSTSCQDKEIHIVGLFIDPDNRLLAEKLHEFRLCRDRRNEQMIEALQKEGFQITPEAVAAENPDSVITRANIARYLYEHGFINSVQEAFERYIGDGCRCYVGRFKVSPEEAVRLIAQAGGLSILAHPTLYHLSSKNLSTLIGNLKSAGLDGIEALYSTYTPAQERTIKKAARDNGLLISGGSDFHGANKPKIKLGTGTGRLHIPYSVLDSLKQRLAEKQALSTI